MSPSKGRPLRGRLVFLSSVVVLACLLAGCTAAPGGPTVTADAPTAAPTPAASPPARPTAGPDAEAEAEAWIARVVVPEDAVVDPTALRPEFRTLPGYRPPCRPYATAKQYWALSGWDVVDTANWLSEHPAEGFVSTLAVPYPPSDTADFAGVGQALADDPFQGIELTVARVDGGVLLRARTVVIPPDAVCDTPPPGSSYGGIGQG